MEYIFWSIVQTSNYRRNLFNKGIDRSPYRNFASILLELLWSFLSHGENKRENFDIVVMDSNDNCDTQQLKTLFI